ncbi:MAG: glycosyltransferase [Salinivirgaceae bacterium]|nr:glycosyltransferase [Salinivirgaceae bacterium]
MKLSIIIPTFNSERLIKRCLESIVCQTMRDFEVLVMDGVSTDNTGEIVKSYNDERIKFYSEPDKGIYDAMNKGIAKAQGEWLYFIGSDDWLLNNNVLQSVFSSEIDKYDVMYGEAESDLPDFCRGEWTLKNIKHNRCHQAIFYRKYLFEQLGLYNLKYPILADHDFNLKWFLNKNIKSKYIGVQIAKFSMGGASSSTKKDSFINDFYVTAYYLGNDLFSIEQKIDLAIGAQRSAQCLFVKTKWFIVASFLRIKRKANLIVK